MGLNILHLSDIHLCGQMSPSAGSILLGNDFSKGAPNVILITGDLFDYSAFSKDSTPSKTQEKITRNIEKGVAFCEALIREINAYYDVALDKSSFLFVPGNHEIQRSATDLDMYLHPYRLFLEKFYDDGIPNWYLEDLSFVKEYEKEKVIIVGFRSPHFNDNSSFEEEYDDYGLIDAEQLLGIRKRLHKIQHLSDYSIIAALHHQFVLMEERDKSYVDRSYLRNSEQFIKFLSEENICTVLHGHKHVNSNRRLNIELDITKPEKIITVLGCGSLSETDNENWFNYITVFPRGYKYDIEYSSYRRTTAGYILEKDAIKIPVLSKRINSILLKNAISEDPDLKRAYDELIGYDTITQVEAISRVLDNTLFSLPSVIEQIEYQPDILYFILATAHYRFLINRNAPKSIIEKVDEFIEEKGKIYFPGNGIYYQITKISEVKDLVTPYKNGIEALTNLQKKIIVFSSMVTLIADYYLIMKYRCEDFYNTVVSKKIDFSYSGSNLTSELRGNTVEFSVDDERRSLEISVTCDTAEAIKICSLIIKEFEILLHDFERDFSDFGFRIYYILPKLKHNGKSTNEIESRQFTAYIPKLLPLLAGRNIYSKPEAFAREVIQNSIDAINVRKEHDLLFKEDGRINITIGNDKKSDLFFFDIEDNGSGMTKYILERYLTTLGLSYYTGADFQSLNLQYNPISQFGIGFLSCFMLGKHIEVYTRHYTSQIGYYLDIPNYDGCFFIEEDKSICNVGTRIRIWENPEQKGTEYTFDVEKIEKYIKEYIKNVSVNISINGRLTLPKNQLWKSIDKTTKKYRMHYFVPIEKDFYSREWIALPPAESAPERRFGVHFYKPDGGIYSNRLNHLLLNDGILVPGISDNINFLNELGENYFCVTLNLPPDTLNLDVSRDNLKNFLSTINWRSVESSFKKYRRSISPNNLPYYILQQVYSSEKYRDSCLVFDFSRESETITVQIQNTKRINDNAYSIIQFLNYLSGDLYSGKCRSFPLKMSECVRQYGDFTSSVISELYEIISCISDTALRGRIVISSHTEDNSNLLLKSMLIREKPLYAECMNLANEISKILIHQQDHAYNLENELSALANAEKGYFGKIRKEIKSNVTNMFKDKRRSTEDISKVNSANYVTSILEDHEKMPSHLYSFFRAYICGAYERRVSKESMQSNKDVSLVDVSAITVSAVYSLLDAASIICSYKELTDGIKLKVSRNELQPTKEWFALLN